MATMDTGVWKVLACGCTEQVVRDDAHRCESFFGRSADDYPWIVAWGAYLGSSVDCVHDEIARARRDEAPLDAYSRVAEPGSGPTHRWRTVDELSVLTRIRLGLPPESEAGTER